MSTLNIELSEFETIRDGRKAALEEVAALRVELAQARMARVDDLVRGLIGSFRAAVEVTRYATAHLSGEFARKWPLKDLLAVADGIEVLPDITPHERELATEFRSFAADVARYDAGRVERYVPPPENPSLPILHAETPGHETHIREGTRTEMRTVKSRATGEVPTMSSLDNTHKI